MKISIGGDHAGFPMKGPVIELLEARGHEVTDYGTHSTEPVDFPDIAARVTEQVRTGAVDRGILVCGTGVGAAIAGNKTPGIRAAVCHDTYSARQCVEHDDVNLLCIGAWIVGIKLAAEIIDAFLAAAFSTQPQFRRRVQKLHELELQSAKMVMAERT
jgi:ribose 5-phosphate isomerase B